MKHKPIDNMNAKNLDVNNNNNNKNVSIKSAGKMLW